MVNKTYECHGVSRLLNEVQLRDFARSKDYVQKYIITTESRDTPQQHVHFFLQGTKSCNRTRLREEMKKEFNLTITKNGQLNIDKKVKDVDQCITYLCKEGYPTFVHGYTQQEIKQKTREAYNPKISMTKEIKVLLDQVNKGQLTPLEYTVEYRLVRNKCRKPDPYWKRQYDNAEEIQKTLSEIESEVRLYSELKSLY